MLKISPHPLVLVPVLAGLSLACSGGGHDLRGPQLAAGQILQTTDTLSLPAGTVAGEILGEAYSFPFASEDRSVTELEVVAVADGRPRLSRRATPSPGPATSSPPTAVTRRPSKTIRWWVPRC